MLPTSESISTGATNIRKDVAWVMFPKLVNGAATFLIAVYSMRFLDPASYGALSLGLSCLSLFEALPGAALHLGTMQLVTGGESSLGPRIEPAEKAAVWLKLAAGAVLVAIFAVAGEWLGQRFFHDQGGRSFFTILTVAGTAMLLLRSAQLYFQARLRFHLYGAVDLAQGVLRLLLAGLVLFWGWASANSILACFAAAPLAIILALLLNLRAAGWPSVRTTRADCRALIRSSMPVLATFSVSSIASRLDLFFLALRGTPAQLGLYGGALTIATIPEMIGAYLAPAYLPRILPAWRDKSFPRLFRRLHLRIYLICGALLVGGLAVGRPVLSLLLPAKYAPSVGLVLILIPGTLAVASFFPLTLNFLMLKRPTVFLIIDSLAAPILAAAYYFIIPVQGAVAVAWITCLYRVAKAAAVQGIAHGIIRRDV